jgi:MFS superfamily sulfate permease-like transporter
MFEQTILDTVIVIGMFVLRVGVPVAILFALAKWVEKKLRPEEQIDERRTSSARIIPFAKPQPAEKNQATKAEDVEVKRANVK